MQGLRSYLPFRQPVWRRRMSFAGNIGTLALLLGGIMITTLMAPAGAAADAVLEAPLLDRAHAREAHRLVERWVRDGAVPAPGEASAADDAGRALRATGVSGVRVTLWRGGVSHGAGEAYPADLSAVTDQPGAATDLTPLLAEATRIALAAVHDTLTEATLRARMDGVDLGDDAQRQPATVLSIAGELLVSVQLARPLETVRLHANAETTELYAHLAPGHHGLRVSDAREARRSAVLWPATALERNMSPRGQLTHLLAATGHDPTAIARLARPDGPRLARFETLHVVRPRQGWPVVELERGSMALPRQPIDEATLDDLARRLGGHLERRFTREGLVRGTYLPTSNRFDPPLAGPEEAALAAYAMTRHARYLATLDGQTEASDARLARAQTALPALTGWVLDADGEGGEPAAAMATASLTLLSLVDAPTRTGEQRELRDALGQWLVEQVSDREKLAAATEGEGEASDAAEPAGREAVQALAVAALAGLYEQQRDAELGAVVAEQMRRLAGTSPGGASLYWRVLAHQRAGGLLPEAAAQEQRTAMRALLGEVGQTFLRRQVARPPSLGPADVVGGFELRRVARNAPPSPDWRTSQVLAFQAVALRNRQMLDESQTLDWLLSAGLAGRFLAQLIVDESEIYHLRSPADALGGVRLAPWDNRQTVAAQAMTLLAITEFQESLDELARRGM